MNSGSIPFGLYIHWPFCRSKCPYCDFNSHVRAQIDEVTWRESLLAEMRHWRAQTPHHQLQTIFFGGGTPSLMAPATVGALIDEATRLWPSANDLEITLEANPTSVEAANFAGYAAAGVNRVSLGVQSLRDSELKFLGRQHDVAEAKAAIALAHKYFPRLSFDLIYARPGQTLADWQAELDEALELGARHISLYQLTIEPNTGFAEQYKRGVFALPADDTAEALYAHTSARLAEAGITNYEISNYAALGEECRHNLIYWNYGDYIGIGPGAHGRVRVNGQRLATSTIRFPERWLEQVKQNGHGLEAIEPVNDPETEALMVGLRLKDGIDRVRWQEKFGRDVVAFVQNIDKLQKSGDIVLSETHLRATDQGRLRLNSILGYLLI